MRPLHAEERRLHREVCLRLERQERLPAWTDSAEDYGERLVNYLKSCSAISGRVYSTEPTLADKEFLVTLWFEVQRTEGVEWEAEARGRSLEEMWEQWNAAEARRVEQRDHAPLTVDQETQTDEKELRGEESDAEGDREAKRLRCVCSTELCGETGTEEASRGSIE